MPEKIRSEIDAAKDLMYANTQQHKQLESTVGKTVVDSVSNAINTFEDTVTAKLGPVSRSYAGVAADRSIGSTPAISISKSRMVPVNNLKEFVVEPLPNSSVVYTDSQAIKKVLLNLMTSLRNGPRIRQLYSETQKEDSPSWLPDISQNALPVKRTNLPYTCVILFNIELEETSTNVSNRKLRSRVPRSTFAADVEALSTQVDFARALALKSTSAILGLYGAEMEVISPTMKEKDSAEPTEGSYSRIAGLGIRR
ncbi:hypothetical protein WH47_04543 [Habropoda laboriosa]|uniref:Uncharacterized protein n=1 Tax=Habropoda laboriosa TaxID=597456 RepID=A0A0L7R291_9HYME|nr:hypothetical protein WH47_04543 [Habropoda laboriosa]